MQYFYNETRSRLLAGEVVVASNFFSRVKGLLGTGSLASGRGIYITPCPQIHMIGMKYAIDAVFIDSENRVIGLAERIAPWQISRSFRKAHGCLELPSGTAGDTGTVVGDLIRRGDAPYRETNENPGMQ